ncbi:MAG: deoxyhypusine synthase, partial [Methanosarcinales archaeon]
MLNQPIKQVNLTPDMSVADLVSALSGCAFGAGRLAQAVTIAEEMFSTECTKFFGLAGALVPAGMGNIISDLIKNNYIDVLVTTGANLVHDILESFGLHHYKGIPDIRDVDLKNKKITRIYDVFLPETHFIEFEEKMQNIFDKIKSPKSIREFLTEIGKHIENKNSILRSAYDNKVPVYCPAIADSIIGLQAWLYKQTKKLEIDAFADMQEFIDICYNAKKTGAFLVGGGVPKNFIMQSMLVTPKSFDYAIQLTVDTPEAGGLSGATLEEAISWGKVRESAKTVTVYGDATITLPIIVAAVKS